MSHCRSAPSERIHEDGDDGRGGEREAEEEAGDDVDLGDVRAEVLVAGCLLLRGPGVRGAAADLGGAVGGAADPEDVGIRQLHYRLVAAPAGQHWTTLVRTSRSCDHPDPCLSVSPVLWMMLPRMELHWKKKKKMAKNFTTTSSAARPSSAASR